MSRQNESTITPKLITPEIQDAAVAFTEILHCGLIKHCASRQKHNSLESNLGTSV